jgi:hypothetical protein
MHDIHEGREDDMDRNNKSPEIGEITKMMIIQLQIVCFLMNPTQLWQHKVSSLEHQIVQGLSFENPNVHNISVSGTTLDQVQKL